LGKWVGRVLTALLALPALYMVAALIGSIAPVNRQWTEPAEGTTVYLADNDIHADVIMPVKAQGLDWAPLFPQSDFAAVPPHSQWIASARVRSTSIWTRRAGRTSSRGRSGLRSPAVRA
jgi:hypothetical protein